MCLSCRLKNRVNAVTCSHNLDTFILAFVPLNCFLLKCVLFLCIRSNNCNIIPKTLLNSLFSLPMGSRRGIDSAENSFNNVNVKFFRRGWSRVNKAQNKENISMKSLSFMNPHWGMLRGYSAGSTSARTFVYSAYLWSELIVLMVLKSPRWCWVDEASWRLMYLFANAHISLHHL